MEKQLWKPGNMIYPLPAVMVSLKGVVSRKKQLIPNFVIALQQ